MSSRHSWACQGFFLCGLFLFSVIFSVLVLLRPDQVGREMGGDVGGSRFDS